MTTLDVRRYRTVTSAAWLRDNGVYAALLLLLLFNLVLTSNFMTVDNFRTQLIQAAPIIVVALGMALVIGTEGVDLSVGAVMALAAAVVPLYLGYGVVPAVAAALAAGLLAGLINGTLVAIVGVQPIVATLALFVGGRGLALVLADGQLKPVFNPTFLGLGSGDLFGIPTIVLVAALVAAVIAFVVRRTTYGRQLVAVGGNRRASVLAGLPVKRVLVTTYVISGLLAAVAGVLATARLQASDPSTIGLLFELYAITAVVVGGTPLSGGKVRVLGTIAGALLMQLIDATLVKHNISDSWSQLAQAVIIIAAVYLQLGRGRKG
jgi:ribose/xylose/arabinose/galactoside ABC-type transport system permease subunit